MGKIFFVHKSCWTSFFFYGRSCHWLRVNQGSHADHLGGGKRGIYAISYHFESTECFITEIFCLGHCVCGSSWRDWTRCCTWKASTWSDGSSDLISDGIWWRIMLVPSTVIICDRCCCAFGCNCSRRGMFGAAFDDFPLASKTDNSCGCAFFLWDRQLEPLAKVLSHLVIRGKLKFWNF